MPGYSDIFVSVSIYFIGIGLKYSGLGKKIFFSLIYKKRQFTTLPFVFVFFYSVRMTFIRFNKNMVIKKLIIIRAIDWKSVNGLP